MKHTLLLCLALAASALFAEEKKPVPPTMTVKVVNETVKADTEVTVKLTLDLPETHEISQRSFFAYFPGLPEGFLEFAKKANLKISHKKPAKWSSVSFDSKWLPYGDRNKKEHTFTLPVKGWPAGDYNVSLNCYFQTRTKDPKVKPVYRQTSFSFTIEK